MPKSSNAKLIPNARTKRTAALNQGMGGGNVGERGRLQHFQRRMLSHRFGMAGKQLLQVLREIGQLQLHLQLAGGHSDTAQLRCQLDQPVVKPLVAQLHRLKLFLGPVHARALAVILSTKVAAQLSSKTRGGAVCNEMGPPGTNEPQNLFESGLSPSVALSPCHTGVLTSAPCFTPAISRSFY